MLRTKIDSERHRLQSDQIFYRHIAEEKSQIKLAKDHNQNGETLHNKLKRKEFNYKDQQKTCNYHMACTV